MTQTNGKTIIAQDLPCYCLVLEALQGMTLCLEEVFQKGNKFAVHINI